MSSENANKARFEKLKQQACMRVPLVREVLADLDTPLSTYLKLANTPYSYLFSSGCRSGHNNGASGGDGGTDICQDSRRSKHRPARA